MQKTMNINVRVGGSLGHFVSQSVGDNSDYDNVSEYIRDLIRKDKASKEQQHFECLKAELQQAFSEPEANYIELSAQDIIGRNTHASSRGKNE